jgi:uncharacterized protein
MNDFRPTQKQERLALLDALRGFALCGILLANLEGFTGAYLLTPAETAAQPATRAVLFLINWFIEGKFYALFSMLFGMGFAMQSARAQQAGATFLPLWYRRMAALTVIGLTHMYLIWHGDILTLYSLLGMLLPFFFLFSNRRLGQCVVVLLLVPLGVHLLAVWTREAAFWNLLTDVVANLKAQFGYAGRTIAQMRTSDSMFEVLVSNWLSAIPRPMAYLQTGRIPQVLGQFLLGVWLARTVLPRIQAGERLPHKSWMLCGTLGLLAGFGYAWIKGATGSAFSLNATGLWQGVIYHTGSTLLALGYAGAFAHWWTHPRWQQRLRHLALLGRMALTNYITQNIIGVLLFYGYGLALMGKVTYATIPLIGAVILLLQWLGCRWWLGHFAQGPLEWLWRKATYRTNFA